MELKNKEIDNGKPYDWGKTSTTYAEYRDVYPRVFYEKVAERGLCVKGQKVLDLGTGTGVFPRNMYSYGADWTAIDITKEQIKEAKRLSKEKGQEINFLTVAAEELPFEENSFDVVTACQCFWYFDLKKLLPPLCKVLKKNGTLVLLYMAWLPNEDKVANASEDLVLKHNPVWTGMGETMHPIYISPLLDEKFELTYREEYYLDVPFTRESWNGRIKASRGIGASLSAKEVEEWEKEHLALLNKLTPEHFTVKHFAAMAILTKRSIV